MTPEQEAMLDRAIRARHDGDGALALSLGRQLHAELNPDDEGWRGVVNGEMGYVSWKLLGDPVRGAGYYRAGVALLPRSELMSLGLFHTLFAQRDLVAALEEIVRFVEIRDSAEYRELLQQAFRSDVGPRVRALADQARALLDRWT